MSGLLVAARTAEPGATVRRAGQPLLRRPWQRLDVVETEDGEAALGFAGERGGVARDPVTGVAAALDGEFFTTRGVESGPEGAATIVRLYLEGGATFAPPDGCFAAAVWDPRDHSLALVADRFGQRPLYFARQGHGVLAAGELKAIVAAGLEPKLDLDTWAQIFAYEHALGGHTAFEGVRLVRGSTTVIVPSVGDERVHERFRYRIEPEPGEERELVLELGRLLTEAVVRRLDDGTGLSLSGGLDSRCLAAVLREVAPDTLAITFGAPDSEDVHTGTQIATRARLPHRTVLLEPGYIARGARDAIWLAEGHVRCFHAHTLALRGLRSSEHLTALLDGAGGDAVLRTTGVPPEPAQGASEQQLALALHRASARCIPDALLDRVFTPRFAAELRGRALSSLACYFAEEEGNWIGRVKQFRLRHTMARMVWPSAELYADELAPRDPFKDAEFVEFCRRVPDALRIDGNLEIAYLRQFPALARVRSPKDGLPPALTGLRRKLAARVVRVRRRGRWLQSRRHRLGRGIGDYTTDLATGGRELLDILLEPRTIDRGQVREDVVRSLIDDLMRGKAGTTRVLGELLTFELFQRQFLEGEGYDLGAAVRPTDLVLGSG
jgi:asparagine synthetase B (glutamine-hydrolysing)